MKKHLILLLTSLFLILLFPCAAQASTVTTVSSLMQVLQEEKQEAVYNIDLNAPFDKDKSGVQETVDVETGEVVVTNQIFSIPGVNGQDISLNLVYRSNEAKTYEEGTKSADTTNSYGQNVIAYYDVFDANGYWLRTGALLYTSSETTIVGETTINSEKWVFTGYLQYETGTSILTGANIQNCTRAKSTVSAAKYLFGAGWSLDIPSLDVMGDTVYVHLQNGETYQADFTSGMGLKDYELYDIVFTKDTSYSIGDITSAYKLCYVSGDSYYFTAGGELLREEDRFGNYINYTWEKVGGVNALVEVEDSAGHSVDIIYGDNATCFKTGERSVTLEKKPFPDQSGQYYLSAFIDAGGRRFGYSYSFAEAAFDSLGKTAVNNTYANLMEILYPTGAKTEYTYEKSKKNLTAAGYMEYFKVEKRQDVDNGKVKNPLWYSYGGEPDGYPDYDPGKLTSGYRYDTEVANAQGLTTKYTFNYQHQPYWKNTYIGDRLYQQVWTAYHTEKHVPEKVVTKTYNTNGGGFQNTDAYQFDNRGNVVSENHYDGDSVTDKNKVDYTYDDAYNVLTSKTYKQDAATVVKEGYQPTEDKKAVASAKIYSNGQLLLNKQYAYDNQGNCIEEKVEKEKGRWVATTYEYGTAYHGAYLTAVIAQDVMDADGNSSTVKTGYTYDFYTGQKLSQTNADGQATSYEYDALGREVKETLPDAAARVYRYLDAENTIEAADANGNVLTYNYSGLGNLLKVKEATAGAVLAAFEYDAYDNLLKRYDGNGNYQANTYDAVQRIEKVQRFDKAGNLLAKTGVSYDEAYPYGNKLFYKIKVTEKGDAADRVTIYYFDANERLALKSRLLNGRKETSSYSYDYLGNNTATKDYSGAVSSSVYDALGRLVTSKDATGSTTAYTYDQLNNLIAQTDGLGQTSYYSYDMLGRQTVSMLPYEAGSYSIGKSYYDGNGNLVKSVDADGYTTRYHYNNRNFLTAVENVTGVGKINLTKYEYDHEGNNTKVLKGLNSWQDKDYAVETYQYDSLGRLTGETDAAGQKTSYSYDNNGNLLTSTDRNGVTVQYTYDGMDRLVKKENSKDGAKHAIGYSYDLLGNMSGMADDSGETSFRYDELGRLTGLDYTNGIRQYYAYDSADRVTKLLVTQGSLTEMDLIYRYDAAGRLTEVNDNGKSFRYAYNGIGQLTKEQNGVTGVLSEYFYYPSGNVKSLRHFDGDTVVANYEYTYDKRGNSTSKTEGYDTTKYYYDALSRISTALTPDGGSQTYRYDDLGNIAEMVETRETPSGSSAITESSYTYDQNSRLLAKETTSGNDTEELRFLYDKEGNQVEKEEISKEAGSLLAQDTLTFRYNGYNQLASVEDGSNSLTLYTYNGSGLRSSKETGNGVINYYYNSGNIILETDADNAVLAKNVRGLRLISRENQGEDPFYYLQDAHGDVTKLLDASAKVIKDYSYDPYGNEESVPQNAFGANPAVQTWQTEVEEINNPFHYCGEYLDSETGNYYLRARYYDPETERFTQEDSAQDGSNWYIYCENNPVIYIDPSGESISDVVYGAAKVIDENSFGGIVDWAAKKITGKGKRVSDSEYDYYLGRSIGDVLSGLIGAGASISGVFEVIGSIAAGGSITVGSGGTLAAGGIAVTTVGVAEGTMAVAYGGSVIMMSSDNFNKDYSKMQSLGDKIKASKKDLKPLDESYLKKHGIDPHKFKKDELKKLKNVRDKTPAHYNIWRNPKTKELFLVPNANIPAIPTGTFLP